MEINTRVERRHDIRYAHFPTCTLYIYTTIHNIKSIMSGRASRVHILFGHPMRPLPTSHGTNTKTQNNNNNILLLLLLLLLRKKRYEMLGMILSCRSITNTTEEQNLLISRNVFSRFHQQKEKYCNDVGLLLRIHPYTNHRGLSK